MWKELNNISSVAEALRQFSRKTDCFRICVWICAGGWEAAREKKMRKAEHIVSLEIWLCDLYKSCTENAEN